MKNNTLLSFSLIISILLSYTSSFYAISGTSITGKVVDAKSKEPLIGANILITGTNIGAATDATGNFQIKQIPAGDLTIQVSMIGYKSEIKQVKADLINEKLVFELTPSLIEMGTIVVTGTNTLHLYENVPVKTEIVTKKLIRQQGACNLSQALGLQTGVMVENDCNNCNFTQVRILGFDGKYSQILIDGDPVIGALGGVYGLEHYPEEMIEQIEIVKGGGSALYGSGAIAGTINMMTRRPAFNSARIGYAGSSADGSYDQQIGAIAELVDENNATGFFVFGSTRMRNPYDRNKDGFTELGQLKNETIGFNSFFKPYRNSELQVSFHRIFEERRGGNDLHKPVHEAEIAEWTKHSKWGGKLKWEQSVSPVFQYKVHYAFSILKRDSYYGGLPEDTPEGRLESLNYYGYSENPLHIGGIQANYILDSHSLTVGFEYEDSKILDQSVSNAAYHLNEKDKNAGAFIQDEFSIGDFKKLDLVAGIRFDKHSAIENWILSPRLNFKYQLFESLKVRGGFSTGFKAPQIFDEDLHICGLEGTQRVIRNADGLKEERSSSYTLGFEFLDFVNDIPVLFGVTAFYTNLFNAYADEFISSEGNIEYWERINSSGANVKGIELDFGFKPVIGLEIRSGFTIKQNEYKEEITDFNTKNFLRTPDHFGYIRTSYDFSFGLSVFTSLKYMGSMHVPHEISVDYQEEPVLNLKKSTEFFELDFAVSKDLKLFSNLKSSITLGIKNITDSYQKDLDYGSQRDPGYVYGPSQPRTIYFGLNVNI